MVIEGIHINTEIFTRTLQQAHYVVISLCPGHDGEACVEHCSPTSVTPQLILWTGSCGERGAREAAVAASVQPEPAPGFLFAARSMSPPVPEACISHWPFTTWGGSWFTLQEPGMNSWGWVGRRIVKVTRQRSSCRAVGRTLGVTCDIESDRRVTSRCPWLCALRTCPVITSNPPSLPHEKHTHQCPQNELRREAERSESRRLQARLTFPTGPESSVFERCGGALGAGLR